VHAITFIYKCDVIGMDDEIRTPKLFHKLNVMAAAFAATAEGVHMLLGVVDGQMNQSMLICQFQDPSGFLKIDPASGPLLDLFVGHIVCIKADLQRVIASFVLCPAQTIGQCIGSRIS
jgi:hypothetical protein